MTTRSPLACLAAVALTGLNSRADTVIEGRVELPKATSVPVVNKRYQVVTKGGEVTINPPQAVVYLEGDFPKSASQPVAQMAQKNLAFVTPLLPVRVGTRVEFPNLEDGFHNFFRFRQRSVLTSGGTVLTSGRFRRRCSTRRGWSRCAAIFTNTCAGWCWCWRRLISW